MKDSENNYIKTNKIPGYNELAESMETVAQESTSQEIVGKIANLDDNLDSGVTRIFDAINLIKEELQGQNSAITLTYLYDTLGDLSTLLDEINGEEMPVEFATDYARQGENSGATNTAILETINEKDIIKQYTIDNSVLNVNLKPNSVYNFFNRTNNLTISLEAPENNDAAIYHIVLEIGNTVPTLTMPEYLTYKAPIDLETDTIFEISILNNYVIYTKW